MKNPFRPIVYSLLVASSLAHTAAANLLTDPDFTGVTYTQTTPVLSSTLFGQVGPDVAGSAASGATLTLSGWTTGGYNFVYAPGTADSGTNGGANTGQPKEAPGQYTTGGYGTTYLWGANNGGASALPTVNAPSGNFIAADGAYEQGAINQSISGLTLGAIYAVSFEWAGAQQQNFSGATTDQWEVSLGTAGLTTMSPTTAYQATSVVNVGSHSSSAWMSQTFFFRATDTTQILSFLAVGTPTGEPPFALLGGVSLDAVPEPSAWALSAGVGVALLSFAVFRRRRASSLRVD